tara:strand:- start:2632 stop:3231 length:600 start_codon:yes stop_codon:yes gene_type:complete
MALPNTTTTPSNAVVTGATLKGPLLTSTGAFNYNAVNQWVATHAGGNPNNVAIVPCKGVSFGSFTMGKGGKAPCKTLGGYMVGATPNPATPTGLQSIYGVRQTMLWHALNGQLTLGQWLNAATSAGNAPANWVKPSTMGIPSGGQSKTNPIVLLALLNGGFSRTALTWGNPQVQLVVKPQTAIAHPAKKAPAKKAPAKK